jgi:hypothetical protein
MRGNTEPDRRTFAWPTGRPRGLTIAAIALVITLVAWPSPLPFVPTLDASYFKWGLGFSWHVALHLAAVRGMRWGHDLVFTYGPLGFLCIPVFVFPGSTALAVGFVTLVTLSFAATSLLALVRVLPLPLAAFAAFAMVVLAGSPFPEVASFSALLLVGLALSDALSPRVTRLVPSLVAAMAAVLLLAKAGSGILLAVTAPLAVLAEPRHVVRRTIVCASVFAVVLVIAWLATGQAPADFAPWLRGVLAATAGYTEAMAAEEVARRWEYFGYSGFVCLVAMGLLFGTDRRRPLPLLALAAILGFAALTFLKSGFVRHSGPGHSTIAFSFLAIAPLMVPWRGRWRLAGVALVAVAGAMVFVVRGVPFDELFDVRSRVVDLSRRISTLADVDVHRDLQASSRARLRASIALPAEILAAVQTHRVHVDPHDVAIAWAYDLDWAPVPMFQSYAAYTPALDRGNAQRLAGPDAPDRILRRTEAAIDGRNALWETPEYALARLCRYQEVAVTDSWQVLARGPDRCGAEREIGVATLRPGELLVVPAASAPDRIVVARLTEQTPLAERLRAALFKPARWLDGLVAGRRERLVRANLGGPLLLRVPAQSGWQRRFDGDLAIEQFAIEGSERPFEVRFAEIPMQALPPAP